MKHKKIWPTPYTGKLLHHRHTSYSVLAAALVFTCVPLIAASHSVILAASDPVTLSNTTYAVVQAPAPATAPAITNITNGAVYTTADPLQVSGSCPDNTLVKVYKNEVFAGAAFCQGGRFSVTIDLFIGLNTLVVRAVTPTNTMAPVSTAITVTKDMPRTNDGTTAPLMITSDLNYKGANIGEKVMWPVTITGGSPPYAVNIAWGDGETDLISRAEPGTFTVSHTYSRPGEGAKSSYDITITTTDSAGNKSFIHLVHIVGTNLDGGIIGSVKQGYNWSGTIRIAWQILIVAMLTVLAFWLGERRESYIVRRKMKTV